MKCSGLKYILEWKKVLSLFCLFLVSCGVLIGNPEDEPGVFDDRGSQSPIEDGDSDIIPVFDDPSSLPDLTAEFNAVLESYLDSTLDQEPDGVDCDLFDTDATETEVDTGRACIRTALSECHPAKIYIRRITSPPDGEYASFVRVTKSAEGECALILRTVSTDVNLFYGDVTKSCRTVDSDTNPEFACGLLD